ncbi:MAG: ATP-binding protein [Arhodomonas sp.]|nr:ATP-binding protein [Arhodomonas sp.]
MTEVEASLPVCSIAGLVLFGHRPRRLLRQAGIRWMAFAGDDKAYDALDDTLIDAPLVALWSGMPGNSDLLEDGIFEIFLDRIRPFVSTEGATDGLRRDRRWDYPVDALREAVVNAVAHRDWTRANEVEVIRYTDRMEVLSPGALQNSMTVEKMVGGQRSPRNPLIVEVLRDYGYVDARGMGVRRKIILDQGRLANCANTPGRSATPPPTSAMTAGRWISSTISTYRCWSDPYAMTGWPAIQFHIASDRLAGILPVRRQQRPGTIHRRRPNSAKTTPRPSSRAIVSVPNNASAKPSATTPAGPKR